MANLYTCAICGQPVPRPDSYIVRMEIFADPSPPEVEGDEEAEALVAEIPKLLQQIAEMSEQELQDGVYRHFEFRVCGACQRGLIANPLGLPRAATPSTN